MTTRELLASLPDSVLCAIDGMKREYKDGKTECARREISAYVRALRDAGYITERERMMLFVYATL